MRIDRMLRWATLVAILAALAPAPAEAQLGRFIKNKLKEKIAKAAVEAVVPADTPVTGAPAAGQGAAPGTAKKAAPGRAVKGGEAPAPASGLTFSEYLPEMTPEVLDRLEKGLAAESAERQAVAKQLARVLSKDAYSDCMQKYVMSPEGQRVHKAIFPEGGGMNKAAMEENVRLIEKKCGPDPSTLGTLKNQLAGKPGEAGLAASGFNYNQYYVLKERALPFCSLVKPASGGDVKIPTESGLFLVYSPTEVQALSARCSRLLPGLKANL